MPDTSELSEARRALLEKYLSGELPQTTKTPDVITLRAEAEVADRRERVVAVQTSGSKRPFFFLHGQWDGKAFFCFSLARDLGADQPFYILEPYRFDSLPVPPSLEDIAAAHIKSLLAVQPEGPYLLGGWCNGALVAYEMARQLYAAGQRLDLLILMDPVSLVYPARNRLVYGVVSCFGNLLRLSRTKQLNWFLCQRHVYNYLLFSQYRRLKNFVSLGNIKQFEPKDIHNKVCFVLPKLDSIFPSVEVLRQSYTGVYDWVALHYSPPSLYAGKITFFWSSEEPFRRGWRKVEESNNEVEIYMIPGTHMTCRTDHIHDLAERLLTCLSKAQAVTFSE